MPNCLSFTITQLSKLVKIREKMKRITKVMCLIALLVLVGTSCKKTETTQSFKAVLEGMTYEDNDGSKMYVEGNDAMFETGDIVRLFNCKYNNTTGESTSALFEATVEGQETTFTKKEGEDDITETKKDVWFAYYPGQLSFPELDNRNRCYFRLDDQQTYRELPTTGKPVIPVMYAAADDRSTGSVGEATFMFQQIGGALSLKLWHPGGRAVKSIKVTDRKFNLAGIVSMKVDKINPITMKNLIANYDTLNLAPVHAYMREIGYDISSYNEFHSDDYLEPNKSITLNCGNKTIGTTKADATRFYIGLRPLALAYGFELEITYDDNSKITLTNTASNKITPGKIINFTLNLASF
jgi:hypothetical protein